MFINPLNKDGFEHLDMFIPLVKIEIPSKALKELQSAYTTRRFKKNFLDSIFFQKDKVAKWCINVNRPFPFFWYRSDEVDYFLNEWRQHRCEDYPFELPTEFSSPESKPSDSVVVPATRKQTAAQLDKIAVQVAANILWAKFPDMTIAALVERKEILKDANGGQYSRKTVRLWVSEVDPRPLSQKTGRPKKKQ